METVNFFGQLARLDITGDLQLTIRKGAEDNWIVSVMLHNHQCGDGAKTLIPPLVLKGTAEELDEGFFDSITTPLQSTSELLINMEVFLKQQEEAKMQSAMEKEQAEKVKKEKETADKKYAEAMKKVDELEEEGKYKEAWMKLPDPTQYPQYMETIRKRKTELSNHFAPDLFGA